MSITPVNGKTELSAVISRLSKSYSAFCPELKLGSLGESVEDAFKKLEKTILKSVLSEDTAKHYRVEASMITITKVFINH